MEETILEVSSLRSRVAELEALVESLQTERRRKDALFQSFYQAWTGKVDQKQLLQPLPLHQPTSPLVSDDQQETIKSFDSQKAVVDYDNFNIVVSKPDSITSATPVSTTADTTATSSISPDSEQSLDADRKEVNSTSDDKGDLLVPVSLHENQRTATEQMNSVNHLFRTPSLIKDSSNSSIYNITPTPDKQRERSSQQSSPPVSYLLSTSQTIFIQGFNLRSDEKTPSPHFELPLSYDQKEPESDTESVLYFKMDEPETPQSDNQSIEQPRAIGGQTSYDQSDSLRTQAVETPAVSSFSTINSPNLPTTTIVDTRISALSQSANTNMHFMDTSEEDKDTEDERGILLKEDLDVDEEEEEEETYAAIKRRALMGSKEKKLRPRLSNRKDGLSRMKPPDLSRNQQKGKDKDYDEEDEAESHATKALPVSLPIRRNSSEDLNSNASFSSLSSSSSVISEDVLAPLPAPLVIDNSTHSKHANMKLGIRDSGFTLPSPLNSPLPISFSVPPSPSPLLASAVSTSSRYRPTSAIPSSSPSSVQSPALPHFSRGLSVQSSSSSESSGVFPPYPLSTREFTNTSDMSSLYTPTPTTANLTASDKFLPPSSSSCVSSIDNMLTTDNPSSSNESVFDSASASSVTATTASNFSTFASSVSTVAPLASSCSVDDGSLSSSANAVMTLSNNKLKESTSSLPSEPTPKPTQLAPSASTNLRSVSSFFSQNDDEDDYNNEQEYTSLPQATIARGKAKDEEGQSPFQPTQQQENISQTLHAIPFSDNEKRSFHNEGILSHIEEQKSLDIKTFNNEEAYIDKEENPLSEKTEKEQEPIHKQESHLSTDEEADSPLPPPTRKVSAFGRRRPFVISSASSSHTSTTTANVATSSSPNVSSSLPLHSDITSSDNTSTAFNSSVTSSVSPASSTSSLASSVYVAPLPSGRFSRKYSSGTEHVSPPSSASPTYATTSSYSSPSTAAAVSTSNLSNTSSTVSKSSDYTNKLSSSQRAHSSSRRRSSRAHSQSRSPSRQSTVVSNAPSSVSHTENTNASMVAATTIITSSEHEASSSERRRRSISAKSQSRSPGRKSSHVRSPSQSSSAISSSSSSTKAVRSKSPAYPIKQQNVSCPSRTNDESSSFSSLSSSSSRSASGRPTQRGDSRSPSPSHVYSKDGRSPLAKSSSRQSSRSPPASSVTSVSQPIMSSSSSQLKSSSSRKASISQSPPCRTSSFVSSSSHTKHASSSSSHTSRSSSRSSHSQPSSSSKPRRSSSRRRSPVSSRSPSPAQTKSSRASNTSSIRETSGKSNVENSKTGKRDKHVLPSSSSDIPIGPITSSSPPISLPSPSSNSPVIKSEIFENEIVFKENFYTSSPSKASKSAASITIPVSSSSASLPSSSSSASIPSVSSGNSLLDLFRSKKKKEVSKPLDISPSLKPATSSIKPSSSPLSVNSPSSNKLSSAISSYSVATSASASSSSSLSKPSSKDAHLSSAKTSSSRPLNLGIASSASHPKSSGLTKKQETEEDEISEDSYVSDSAIDSDDDIQKDRANRR